VLSTEAFFAAFYDDDRRARLPALATPYSGNPTRLPRRARRCSDLFERDDVIATNRRRAARFDEIAAPLAAHPRVRNFRRLGMIWAFEVEDPAPAFASRAFEAALARGVLLSPDREYGLFHAALCPHG
jgi:adenosylmethionine-8-amino-7-oxononanoate aminotransferase